MNQCSVIHIPFNDIDDDCSSYSEYIDRIKRQLIDDIEEAYPDIAIDKNESLFRVLINLYSKDSSARFVFVLDE